MAIGQTRRSASRATWTACAVLVVGASIAPQVITPAQPAAAADGDCTTYSVPTYVWEPATTNNIAAKRVLHKYMEWGPKSPDAALLDTLNTASLPMTSKVFTGGGDGILYEATIGGQVKAYKDNTSTGGSLLTPVKTYSLNWSSAKRILTNGQPPVSTPARRGRPARGPSAPRPSPPTPMGAKTGYDSNHKQKITAGNKSGKHWVWGKNGSISSGKAGVFYSK